MHVHISTYLLIIHVGMCACVSVYRSYYVVFAYDPVNDPLGFELTTTTKSLDPIVVTAFLVDFPVEILGPSTGGSACNCPIPDAWTTEAFGHSN